MQDLTPVSLPPSAGVVVATSQSGESASKKREASAARREQELSARQEALQLREADATLREQELAARKALLALEQQRCELQGEVVRLQMLRSDLVFEMDVAKKDLEVCRQQRNTMKKKLAQCRNVIAQAVASVDGLYAKTSSREEVIAADEAVVALAKKLEDDQEETVKQRSFNGQENSEGIRLSMKRQSSDLKVPSYSTDDSQRPFRVLNA
jgi:chromosome segregation ATPase